MDRDQAIVNENEATPIYDHDCDDSFIDLYILKFRKL